MGIIMIAGITIQNVLCMSSLVSHNPGTCIMSSPDVSSVELGQCPLLDVFTYLDHYNKVP
jgi:hypothetical protein